VTGLTQVALLATVILAATFVAARGLRECWGAVEQYRAYCALADAADEWDAAVTDALRLAAIGRHPTSQRRSVAGLWRAMYPREQTRPPLRLVEDQ